MKVSNINNRPNQFLITDINDISWFKNFPFKIKENDFKSPLEEYS